MGGGGSRVVLARRLGHDAVQVGIFQGHQDRSRHRAGACAGVRCWCAAANALRCSATAMLPATGACRLRRIAHELAETAPSDDALAARCADRQERAIRLAQRFPVASGRIESAMRRLARSGLTGHLVHIVDPAEEDFPFAGRTRFESVRGGESELFGRAEIVAAAYRARFQGASVKRCAALARRLGWSYLAHRTDKRPETALVALYADLGGIRTRDCASREARGHVASSRPEFRRSLDSRRRSSILPVDLLAAARDAARAAPRRLSALAPVARTRSAAGNARAHAACGCSLLRLLAAALVIVALAAPVIGQAAKIAGTGPIVLFVDNDWPAAQAWKDRAGRHLRRAGRRRA